jgi:hypothetical protein
MSPTAMSSIWTSTRTTRTKDSPSWTTSVKEAYSELEMHDTLLFGIIYRTSYSTMILIATRST